MIKKIGTISTITISAILLGIVVTSFPSVMAGGPMTLVVDDDGMAVAGNCDDATATPYTTIQSAVDAANPGDTVIVCPHDTEYAEAVDIDESDITVEGVDKPKVNGTGASPAFTINGDGVVLSGFEAISNDDDCIFVTGDNNRIVGNLASNCGDDGIEVLDGDGNTINGNRANNNDDGIKLTGDDNTLRGNTANNNTDDGFECDGECQNTIFQGNTANDNGDEGFDLSVDNSTIRGNTANNNGDDGIDLNPNADDNLVKGNTANDNDEEGFEIGGDRNTITNNNANNNDFDGIELEGDAIDNVVTHNVTNDNGDLGIDDNSPAGGGTAGTSNTYDKNKCRNNGTTDDDGSDPDGLCRPQN